MSDGVGHDHHHHAEPREGSAVVADASLALDVGADRGALVIYPDEAYRGLEIEIENDAGERVHTGVHERTTFAGETRLTAVFGSLAVGEYTVVTRRNELGPVVEVAADGYAEVTLER